jgi:hypothetical protein
MQQSDIKRILTKDYGWPDDFRQEEWGNNYKRVWEEARIREADRVEHGTGAWASVERNH